MALYIIMSCVIFLSWFPFAVEKSFFDEGWELHLSMGQDLGCAKTCSSNKVVIVASFLRSVTSLAPRSWLGFQDHPFLSKDTGSEVMPKEGSAGSSPMPLRVVHLQVHPAWDSTGAWITSSLQCDQKVTSLRPVVLTLYCITESSKDMETPQITWQNLVFII